MAKERGPIHAKCANPPTCRRVRGGAFRVPTHSLSALFSRAFRVSFRVRSLSFMFSRAYAFAFDFNAFAFAFTSFSRHVVNGGDEAPLLSPQRRPGGGTGGWGWGQIF